MERALHTPPGLEEITSVPSPASPGAYRVCSHDYEFAGEGREARLGRFYAPVLAVTREGRCLTHGKFPLVLIAHADGQGLGSEAHTYYDALATHLASHALMVASMNRSGISPEEFDTLLQDHVNYIYHDSPIKDFVTDDIALLGHSAGGRSVIHNAGVINDATTKHLKAVIFLASTVDANFEKTFAGETAALMGINVVIDSDANAFGAKVPGQIMQSTFKIYDEAGVDPDEPDLLSLEKDMIFANGSDPMEEPHYFQNSLFAKGYINAFLQLHLRGHGVFRRFFKQQEKMPLVSTPIFQQHADPAQLTVANFENGSIEDTTIGGWIQILGDSIANAVVGHAHQLDEFSCHHTQVMKFEWTGWTQPGGPDRITFHLGAPYNLQPYRYVAFRITQVYEPVLNPEGTPRDFSVRIHSQGGDDSVPVSLFGGELHFPIKVPAPAGALQEEQTKNAMRSYLIPLRSFEDVDLGTVEAVTFDFSEAGDEPTTFILDDIAFWF